MQRERLCRAYAFGRLIASISLNFVQQRKEIQTQKKRNIAIIRLQHCSQKQTSLEFFVAHSRFN